MPKNEITFDDLKNRKKPVRKRVFISMDESLAEEFEDAKKELKVCESLVRRQVEDPKLSDRHAQAKKDFKKAEDAARGSAVEFTFRSIGRKKFEALMREYPITDEQRVEAAREGVKGLSWNPDTFLPALTASSLESPKLSEDEILALWNDDSWNPAELTALYETALEAQSTGGVVDLGN